MSSVSVITAAIPSRVEMLGDAMASVRAQRHPALEHLIAVDYDRVGSAAVRNTLAAAARGAWVAVLDDDDYLLPNHLEVLVAEASRSGADIVYPYCQVTGRMDGWVPNQPFNPDRLREGNFIPATALVSSDVLAGLGGWRDSADCPNGWEDWDLWLRALDAGARFACAPVVTWVYRFHGGNKTMLGERAAA